MYPFLKDASFRSCFCFVHTIDQFSRILRFSHIYCQIFRRVPFVDGSDRMHYFNDRVRKVPDIYYFEIMTKPLYRIKIYSKMHRESTKVTVMSKWPLYKGDRYDRFDCSYMVKYLIKFVVIINRRWEKLIYLWTVRVSVSQYYNNPTKRVGLIQSGRNYHLIEN
jgi:hypothetical protein